MKKFFFLLCFLPFAMNAQPTSKGNFIMGGTLGFSTATSTVDIDANGTSVEAEGARASQFNIAPSIGYFLTNNFAMGVGLDYTRNKTEEPIDAFDPDSEVNETFDSDLLFGPFLRGYLPIGADKAFFIETTFGFGASNNEFQIDDQSQTTATNVIAIGVGPGFTIFSRDAFGIEALAKYNWARSSSDIDFQGVKTSLTTFTNQIDFSVGFQIYFTRFATAGG